MFDSTFALNPGLVLATGDGERPADRPAQARKAQEQDAALRQAQRIARLAWGITRGDSVLESWSETLPVLTGVDPARMPKSVREWLTLIHPDDQATFRDAGVAAAKTGERFDIEYRLQRGDGAWVVLRHVADPLPESAEAGARRWFNTIQDVTGHRHALQSLRASEEQLRMLVESSPLAIYTRDREGLLTSWSPAAERMFGWSAAEVLGKPLPSVPEEARAESDQLRTRLLGGEKFINKEGERRRRDGSTIHINSFLGPLHDGAGNATGIIAVVADVTEQKMAEQALRESEARFRGLTALSSDWYWEQDENFRFVNMSSEVAHAAGSSAQSHIGKTRWELPVVGVSDEAWARHRADLEAHRLFRDFEFQRINELGETIWMSASGEPVFDAAGKFKGYRGVGREITERKRGLPHRGRGGRVPPGVGGAGGRGAEARRARQLARPRRGVRPQDPHRASRRRPGRTRHRGAGDRGAQANGRPGHGARSARAAEGGGREARLARARDAAARGRGPGDRPARAVRGRNRGV